MNKNTKRKLLFTTIFMSMLMISITYAFLTPNAYAAQPTAPEKSLAVLNDVAGFNMTAYAAALNTDRQNQYLSSPQEEADFRLSSPQGSLRATCSFVQDRLHQIFISDLSGSPHLNQPAADAVGMAKGFLQRYQSCTEASFYGDLKSMLDTVNAGENVTKTVGNVKLTVSNLNQALVDFMWTYVDENGVPAMSKDVVLSYRNGLLKCFLDNWQLYSIAAKPKLSSEEAVAIALDAAKNYSWTVANTENSTMSVSGFKIVAIGNTTLSYLNYGERSSARGGDPFELYPSWYVPLGFDRVYPGCVTGLTVRVWADSGEVSGISPMVAGDAASNTEKSNSHSLIQEQTIMLTAPLAVAVVMGVVIVSFGRNKVGFLKSKSMRKSRLSKLSAAVLCLLISFSIVLAAVPKAKAIPVGANVKSMIYASRANQTENEKNAASQVCDYLEDSFYDAGYDAENDYGSQTTKSTILNNTYDLEHSVNTTTSRCSILGTWMAPTIFWAIKATIPHIMIVSRTLIFGLAQLAKLFSRGCGHA